MWFGARVTARQHELTAELAAVDGDRWQGLRAAIDTDKLTHFDRIVAGRGTASLAPRINNALAARWACARKSGTSSARANCSAATVAIVSLYWDPAIAAVPKAPQPELIPGAGRAPRKPRQAGA